MRAGPVTVVALDIGGSSVKSGCVVDGLPSGDLSVTPLDESGPVAHLVEALVAAIDGVAAGDGTVHVAAAVPDPFDHTAGVSLMIHKFAALRGVALEPLLAAALGRPLEVRWCNDAAAAVAGEAHAGAGAGCRTVLGVTLGTGLGAALVSDGAVVARVGDVVIGNLWRAQLPDGRSADSTFSARSLRSAVARGAADRFGAELAGCLAPLAASAHADVVVVGGGGAGSFDDIAEAMRAALPVPVVRARLGRWGALVGAVQLCWPEPAGTAGVPDPDR